MTRDDAKRILDGPGEIDYVLVADIFTAFGFHSASPSYEVDVYYHPKFHARCGKFTAVDRGHGTISGLERSLIKAMLNCVAFMESADQSGQMELGPQ